jgi:hypothetical protein
VRAKAVACRMDVSHTGTKGNYWVLGMLVFIEALTVINVITVISVIRLCDINLQLRL